jgi:uncharacterized Ntn-hydrolase superfamily protein
MTFSILGRCAKTGMLGMAISSSSPAVAARCAHARAGVGAVASQNVTDPTLGPKGLDLMQSGRSAEDALAALVASAPHIEFRQLVLLDARGESASYSGPRTLGTHGTAQGRDCAAAGNLLASESVPLAMTDAFAASSGHLGARLLGALEAGLAAGGEAGPVHSAGLMVVDKVAWPVVDLRIDWHETDPLAALRQAWQIYEPQITDYINRALDPTMAPGYGVPGEK